MLSPLKDNQARMEKVLSDIQKALAQNQKDLADNKQHINRVEKQQKKNTDTLKIIIDYIKALEKNLKQAKSVP